jgi:hypothetical protein
MNCRVENCARSRLPDSSMCRDHLRETWKYGHAEPVHVPEWLRRSREGRGLAKELSR